MSVGSKLSRAMHSELLCYLHLLFNGLLSHLYMLHDFLLGNITPIIKDLGGDHTSSSNYSPITLGPILLQLFEYLLMNKFLLGN